MSQGEVKVKEERIEEGMEVDGEEAHGSTTNMTMEQAHTILDFMASHTKFCANQAMGCDPKRTKEKLSEQLMKLVNEKGSNKTVKQILRWWSSAKTKAKKYNGKKKMLSKATGNPEKKLKTNAIYDRVIEIVGTNHGNGLPLIPEVGFENASKNDASDVTTQSSFSKSSARTSTVTSGELSKENSGLIMQSRETMKSDVPSFLSLTTSRTATSGQSLKASSGLMMQCRGDTDSTIVSETALCTQPSAHIATGQLSRKSYEPVALSNVTCGSFSSFANTSTNSSSMSPLTKDNVCKKKLINQISNRVVLDNVNAKIKVEPVVPQNYAPTYMQQLREFASGQKNKTNLTQMRTLMTMNALSDGTNSLRELTNRIVESNTKVAESNAERNKLIKEQNEILLKLLNDKHNNKEN